MTLLRRFLPDDRLRTSARHLKPFLPLLLYAGASLLIAAIYAISFRHIERMVESDKLSDLGAVADAKVAQIVHWREEQRRVGESLSRDSLLAAEFAQWLRTGAQSDGQKLRRMLAEVQTMTGYLEISLVDRGGKARMTAGGRQEMGEEDRQLAARAMDGREVVFADFHRNSRGTHGVSLDLAVPLISGSGQTARVAGAAVIQIDPEQFLYPLIQSWPTRSGSAETLLVRREGDEVLFLGNVRHREGAALTLRMPLSALAHPATMALRGATGTTEGIDYRGVTVVAEMRPVPGTPWFMVSKIDRDELFAPIRRLRAWSMGLATGFVALGGLLLFLWLRNQRTHYQLLKTRHDAAVERELLTKRYEYLTKYANDIILVTDVEGRVIEANARASEAYGYSHEEFMKVRIHGLCDCATERIFCDQPDELLGGAGESRFESMTRRKDGSTFPVEVSSRVIRVEDTQYLQFIMRDITERRQAEEALRKSERLLKESQQMARIGSWEMDLVENVLYWSDENYRIFGMDRERFGASYEAFLNIVHPDDRDMVNKAYTESVRNHTPYMIVHRLLFPDQRIKFVREWCETYYDENGRPLRSIGTTQDITEQQLAKQKLVESEERFRIMADLAPIMIWLADAQGGETYLGCNFFNRGWHEFTGMPLEQTRGMAWLELVHSRDRERCHAAYANAFRKLRPFKLEYRLRHHDGKFRWVQDSGIPRFTDDGRFLGFIGTCIDTSEQRSFEAIRGEMEHAGRLNLAGEMASGLAHELSQPLTAANNYLDACLRRMEEREWDREKLQQAVKLAHLQTERAGKIIGQLKSLVRRQGHERSMTDIGQVIRNAAVLLEREFQYQSVTVMLDLPSLPQISANRVELEQVLINLMKNAVEAMAGQAQRELRLAAQQLESGDVLVTVGDSGCGIGIADMDKIFNPFHTTKPDGLGLGLSICRTLVENYGGRIWAEPRDGGGTDFNFTLSVGRPNHD
jgi:PAS domain S-box-containing protein